MSIAATAWRSRLPDALLALVTLAHLWPLVTGRWVMTLDGPCHVYNARLALELFREAPAAEFFWFNQRFEPNLLGYQILAALQLFLPAWLSMQLLYATIVTGTALAFRSIARTLAPGDPWAPLLGLPFLLTYPLVMGFFNFSLGVAMLLFTAAAWERQLRAGSNRAWLMLVLAGLLYLAHLTAFLVGATWLVIRTAWAWLQDEEGARARIGRHAAVLFLSLAMPGAFVTSYFNRAPAVDVTAFRFGTSELLQWVIDGRAWITFSYDDDLPWTRAMAIMILLLACVAIGVAVVKRKGQAIPWFLSALGLFALYLILPDVLAGGSLNSPRMLLFTMLFLSIGVIAARLPRTVTLMAGTVIALASVGQLNAFMHAERGLQADADDLLTLAPHVNERSVVLPLNYSDNWLHSNLSNLLGAETGAIILDHFVAQAPFAPVQWLQERMPYEAIGDFDRSNRPCVRIDGYRNGEVPLVTHVLMYRIPKEPTDSCSQNVIRQLEERFSHKAGTPGGAVLYERR